VITATGYDSSKIRDLSRGTSARRWPTDSTVAETVKPVAAFHTILMLFALAVGATLVLRAGPVEARPPPPRGMDIAPEPAPGRFFQVRNENGYRSVVSIARKAGVDWRWVERSEWNRDRYFNPSISDNLRPNGGLSLSPKFASHGSQIKPRNQKSRTGHDWPLLWIPALDGDEPGKLAEIEFPKPVLCPPPLEAAAPDEEPGLDGASVEEEAPADSRGGESCPADLSDFTPCTSLPSFASPHAWLDNTALERVRNQPRGGGRFLVTRARKSAGSKERRVVAEAHRALNQNLALWSCAELGVNILLRKGEPGPFKAANRFTAATQRAVAMFQHRAGITRAKGKMGRVDRATLLALDRRVGVARPQVRRNPKLLGDTGKPATLQGQSRLANGLSGRGIEPGFVAHIYFTTKGAKLSKDDLDVIGQVANFYAGIKPTYLGFAIHGFADNRDPFLKNKTLGYRRVDAVEGALLEAVKKQAARMKDWQVDARARGEYFGEVERPQVGRSGHDDEDLRRFRRVDILLSAATDQACWACTDDELRHGVTNDRAGCDALACVAEVRNEYVCDDLEGKEWAASGEFTGGCYEFACIESGQLILDNGVCHAVYDFIGKGIGGSAVPIPASVSVTPLSRSKFRTVESVNFGDFEGQIIHYTAGVAAGVGAGVDSIQFIAAGRKHGMVAPIVRFGGVSGGAVAVPGAAVIEGELDRLTHPIRNIPR